VDNNCIEVEDGNDNSQVVVIATRPTSNDKICGHTATVAVIAGGSGREDADADAEQDPGCGLVSISGPVVLY
jgi:hypothetical protein